MGKAIKKNFLRKDGIYSVYSYYQQQPSIKAPSYITTPTPVLKGHPVSSLEEVKATSIDFDGSIFYFPDIANKRIYTKAVDMQGIATLNMYVLQPLPPEVPNTGDFITRQEFEQTITQLINQIPKTESTTPPSNYKEVF